MDRWPRSSRVDRFGVVVVAVAVLYLAKPVLLPLAVALLLSVVISPSVQRLEQIGLGRFRIGRIGSVVVVALALAAVVAGMGWVVGVQGGALVEKLPEYRRTALTRLREPLESLRRLERTAREVREMAEPPGGGPTPPKVEVVEGGSELVGLARGWAGSVASLLGTAGLVIVLLGFLLVEREGLRDRLIRVVAGGDLHTTTSAFRDAVDRVTSYLRALALVNLGHGAVVAVGLASMGLSGALLFGLLSAVLRFVPYVGPWVAASLPIALALATAEGWSLPLAVVAFFVVLELLSNNLLEPLVIGSRIGLSPFAMIASTIFWAWLWGPIGIVLAAPISACLVAFGRYAPSLEPLAILLSDADALPPAERLYQRLLARDSYEATALLAERTQALGALAAWDEVVLPALAQLERDRREQRLEPEQIDVARETFELALNELPEPGPEAAAPPVLCIPAHSGWDETVCSALARFLSPLHARALGHKLSAELTAEVAQAGAIFVCISCLASPAGAARHLVTRIRKACPEAKLVIGLWGRAVDAALEERVGADAGTYVTNRLAEATERVRASIPI
jgi:predicted PurR-regulated permease PerM